MFDFSKLWSKTYLFGPAGFELVRSDKIFFLGSLAAIVISAVIKLIAVSKDKNSPSAVLLARFFHLFLTTGIVLLIWTGAREQGIPWVSAHFLAIVILLAALVWLAFILKFYFRKYRVLMRDWADEKIKRKYLA
jgi:hypothetical protein